MKQQKSCVDVEEGERDSAGQTLKPTVHPEVWFDWLFTKSHHTLFRWGGSYMGECREEEGVGSEAMRNCIR